MISVATTVNSKYQIVIPKEIRKVFPIKPEEKIIFKIDDKGRLILEKIPTILSLQGSYQFPENYLTNERDSWSK